VEVSGCGLVKAEAVEAKVRLVLESEEGGWLRAHVRALKKTAALVWKEEGGSSRAAFDHFFIGRE
jgi:hypothetical protein